MRVPTVPPVSVQIAAGEQRVLSHAVNVSGGGILLAGPSTLSSATNWPCVSSPARRRLRSTRPAWSSAPTAIAAAGSASRRSATVIDGGWSASSSRCCASSASETVARCERWPMRAGRSRRHRRRPTSSRRRRRRRRRPGCRGDSDKGDKSGKEAKSKKSGKEAKGKKGKGKKSDGDDAPDGSSGMSLAAHPRAAQRVSEAKSWGALGGFLAGGYLSLSSHTVLDAGVRALAAGAACYVIVWGAAVFVWRRLLVAELRRRT